MISFNVLCISPMLLGMHPENWLLANTMTKAGEDPKVSGIFDLNRLLFKNTESRSFSNSLHGSPPLKLLYLNETIITNIRFIEKLEPGETLWDFPTESVRVQVGIYDIFPRLECNVCSPEPGISKVRSKLHGIFIIIVKSPFSGSVESWRWAMDATSYSHVLRTGNSVVNLLAKRATHSDFEMHIVSDPDATLRQLLQSDMDAHAGRVD
ncbi:hypothetical protein V6N13_035484 [Hibiscus sabdariffa]